MFPLKDPGLCQQVCMTILAPYLADTDKTRFLLPDGIYHRARKIGETANSRNGNGFNVQEFFVGVAEGREEQRAQAFLRRFLKQQSSPVFDLLTTKWEQVQAD
jgi:hypothetical protein